MVHRHHHGHGERVVENREDHHRRGTLLPAEAPQEVVPTRPLRWSYAVAISRDDGATLDDLREAVTTLEEIEPIARRVLSGAHPITQGIERALKNARAALVRASLAK